MSPCINMILIKIIQGLKIADDVEAEVVESIQTTIDLYFSSLNKKVPNVQVVTD